MVYKAVFNDNSLYHYNKNHSSKNGQFVSGDGDGDGITDDHAHRSERKKSGKYISGFETDKEKLKKTRQKIIKDQKTKQKKLTTEQKIAIGLGAAATLATVAGIGAEAVLAARKRKLGKEEAYEEKRSTAEFIERQYQRKIRQESANAKFVGGDW